MTFVFDLPNSELLPRTFDLVSQVEAFAEKTKILELRTPPREGESASDAGKRVMKDMAKRACTEFPEETGILTDAMWILEDGEKAPNALVTFTKCIRRDDVMDFFISLLSLG